MEKSEFVEHDLTRRERQIMNVVYKLGKVTVADVVNNIPDPPSTESVRALLLILTKKGFLRSEERGPRKIYHPTVGQEKAAKKMLSYVVETFFGGSSHRLVAALLDINNDRLDDKGLERLAKLIEAAGRKEQEK